ncbi:MAG: dihydroneopterin aldolase [Betaproteobacteria bacterium]|jgi:dihydroneopterin aldolase|nr:MAG: dihydroneopterin aldolase [Betaproteobacteria bacterium]
MDASAANGSGPTTAPRGAGKLENSRCIFLRNFNVFISMGVHDFEKQAKQRVIVNVDLYIDPNGRIQHDTIRETVDYDFVRKMIQEIAEIGHFHLQETFCERILDTCLEKSGVLAARVSSEKPDIYPDCESVGFEIFRVK